MWGNQHLLFVISRAATAPPSTPYCLNECIYSWRFCPIWPHSGGKARQYWWPPGPRPVVLPQIDLSDSNSYSSDDDNSGSCKIVESVGNKGKTSFVCLSGDVRRVMSDKVKVNASKGNLNVPSAEIAMMMLRSLIAKRTQLVKLAGGA